MADTHAEIGIFGGSGFYSFLEDVRHVQMHTPYGAPSAALAIGTIDGRRVAFLPRHGTDHQFPAHKVNYRANIWAMKQAGVKRLIGPSAAGSLKASVAPGDVVVLDQLVDRTSARNDTFFDGGVPGHVSLADPYCPELRDAAIKVCRNSGIQSHDQGTVVVINGPRFSTRAESNWYRSFGWEVINMTQYPEVALARELGICYSGLALITDYDTGLEGEDGVLPVAMDDVFAMLKANAEKVKDLLRALIPSIPSDVSCPCSDALNSGPLRP